VVSERLEMSLSEMMDEFNGEGQEEYITKELWYVPY
jgi:hypothetical protein